MKVLKILTTKEVQAKCKHKRKRVAYSTDRHYVCLNCYKLLDRK